MYNVDRSTVHKCHDILIYIVTMTHSMSTVLPGNLVRHTEFPHSVATEETTLRKNSWELWPPTFCDVVAMLYVRV